MWTLNTLHPTLTIALGGRNLTPVSERALRLREGKPLASVHREELRGLRITMQIPRASDLAWGSRLGFHDGPMGPR